MQQHSPHKPPEQTVVNNEIVLLAALRDDLYILRLRDVFEEALLGIVLNKRAVVKSP